MKRRRSRFGSAAPSGASKFTPAVSSSTPPAPSPTPSATQPQPLIPIPPSTLSHLPPSSSSATPAPAPAPEPESEPAPEPATATAPAAFSFKPVARGKRRRPPPKPAQPLLPASDDSDSDAAISLKRTRRPPLPLSPTRASSAAAPPPLSPAPPPGVDALDAFMSHIRPSAAPSHRRTDSVLGLDDDDAPAADDDAADDAAGFLDRNKKKRPVYERIDHALVAYAPFEKCLYREVTELARMTGPDVAAARRALGNVRIRGKRCPKPISSFAQAGLSSAVLDVIRQAAYKTPTPIQAQAIPCIMSGRDVIGVAKTGSGKTLAFLLPVLRHVALQERPKAGEGPIALLVVPTRELAIQIYGEARRFAKVSGLRCVCAYGGSGVKDQISDLKRGADIVVCTPGRMIDLLAMNSGRITNLRRVTVVVLDEADRMFDMGFEPQLTRLVENVRPDRQTVMFSATFPSQVERLARMILKQPVEIVIGGNSVAANTIDQHIEVRAEETKFRRLLQLLGVWYEKGASLVFVDRQDNADRIYGDLSKAGYLCMSLHGGMDQADRDSALADFKNGVVKVLVATSVAARGLDVKDLTLVVNFDVPNHYEDYVHRVGRTGRAGRAGTAHTFITPDQGMFAGDMVKALEQSARMSAVKTGMSKDEAKEAADGAAQDAVSEELRLLASEFREGQDAKRKAGLVVHGSNSGYGGRGFTFEEGENDALGTMRDSQAKRLMKESGVGDGDEDGGGDGEDDNDDADIKVVQRSKVAKGDEESAPAAGGTSGAVSAVGDINSMIAAAEYKARVEARREKLGETATAARIVLAKTNVIVAARSEASRMPVPAPPPVPAALNPEGVVALSAAAAAAATLSARLSNGNPGDPVTASDAMAGSGAVASASGGNSDTNGEFEAELEINDYPQHARWRVTHANALEDVTDNTGCVATTRGNFYAVGRNPPPGERKLHLLIEGPDERSVRSAYKEIRRKLEEAAEARPEDRGISYSKYSVV